MSKYKKLSRKVLANIERTLTAASLEQFTSGLSWYAEANAWIESKAIAYNVGSETIAALVAVLSPGQEWERNKRSVESFMDAFQAGKRGSELPKVSVYGNLALIKAEAIAYGQDPLEVLSGPKVCAFYECLVRPTDSQAVVVDRHARCLALGLGRSDANGLVKSLGEYQWLAKHYVKVAESRDLLPLQVQAITWTTWRENEPTVRSMKES